jgi:hypothetical protein
VDAENSFGGLCARRTVGMVQEVVDRRQVLNCVVNEHAIELATQGHRAHVAMNVRAFRIDPPALREPVL